MTSRLICTLDRHRLGSSLSITQGDLVVTTTDVCDFHRAVFGTLPMGAGQAAFECQFYSTSRPAAGLANLCSVGVAEATSALNKYVGEETTSFGFRPTEAEVCNNNASISGSANPALQPTAERQVIGVFLDATVSPPICVWHVNGNPIFQTNLSAGKFYVPAISIGSATPADVSAFCNFGQRPFMFPIMSVTK